MTKELQKIDAYMTNLCWRRDVSYTREVSFVRRDGGYAVTLRNGWWDLGEFTDGDIGDRAVGRFEAFEDGETLMELIAALRELPRVTHMSPAEINHTLSVALIGNGLFVRVGRKR